LYKVQRLQPNLKPIQTWKEVLSKRVPILGEGIACNQDPDSLHCKALKRAKSLGELKIKSLGIIPLILILLLFRNLKILDLDNTLVVEIQKGILLYSCHIVRKFLNIDTEHNKTQQSQNVEARRR
jgi:hypothetical protein